MSLESADDAIWKVHDKQWMAQRKEEWKKVKYALNIMTEGNDPRYFKKKYHRYHQNLFFYGQKVMDGEILHMGSIDGYDRYRDEPHLDKERFLGGDPFFRRLPFFEIWYHPRPELLDLDGIRLEWLKNWSLPAMWKMAQKLLFVTGKNGKPFDPEYGAMGGREKLIVELCCPDVDYKKLFPCHSLSEEQLSIKLERSEDYLQPCPRPKELVRRCLRDTHRELSTGEGYFPYYPYAPGQYLWNHLSFAVENYTEEAMGNIPLGSAKSTGHRGALLILWELLNFDKRTDFTRNRESTIEMVQRLVGQYERNEFSPTLMKLWEEAKDIDVANRKELWL